MAQYDRRPGDTALCFASWARTALDDPAAVADEDLPKEVRSSVFREVTPSHVLYAIDRIDDLFQMLDPAEETRETLSRALSEAGLILASIQETIESIGHDGCEAGSDEEEAYRETASLVTRSLDTLDTAIAVLTPDEGEGE